MKEKDFLAIKELLVASATDEVGVGMADEIAKKAFLDRHLYEDMGFESRALFSEYMAKLYPVLSAKKPVDVRWKKFLFDSIGSIAPACYSCGDTDICFKCDLMN